MAGLEEIDIPGPEHLREAITNCTDPLAAIEQFQIQNGILLPSLKPALPFLDLHGLMRSDFHHSVMEELRDRLLQQIAKLSESNDPNKTKTLSDLLSRSCPVVRVKALRPVVLCIMRHLPRIKPEYLKAVLDDPELYRQSDVRVKQQIWQDNQPLFGDEISPLLSKYIDSQEEITFSLASPPSPLFFSSTPKARRQSGVVREIVEMIGKTVRLYDMVLQFLRTLYSRTRNVHYCTLRSELLMAFHDSDVNDICSVDPCYKFTWCLDACVRERYVDSKRSKELVAFLDGVRHGHEKVFGDLAMILCDPHSIHTLIVSIMKILQQCVGNEILPRQSDELIIMLRLLSLGLGAWEMIDKQYFKEPKPDLSIFSQFLPVLMSMTVDEQLQQTAPKVVEDQRSEEAAKTMQKFMERTFKSSNMAGWLLLYYTVHVAKASNTVALCRLLMMLTHSETTYEDTNMHLLISHLSSVPEQFNNSEMADAAIDHLLLANVYKENIVQHLMRLLYFVQHKLPQAKLISVIDILEPMIANYPPNQPSSNSVKNIYKLLKEKIADTQQQAAALLEQDMTSPVQTIVSVPSIIPLLS